MKQYIIGLISVLAVVILALGMSACNGATSYFLTSKITTTPAEATTNTAKATTTPVKTTTTPANTTTPVKTTAAVTITPPVAQSRVILAEMFTGEW
jgi:hypothetical protein